MCFHWRQWMVESWQEPGHTEASCDLAKLSGLSPSGVICEIMNDDELQWQEEMTLKCLLKNMI